MQTNSRPFILTITSFACASVLCAAASAQTGAGSVLRVDPRLIALVVHQEIIETGLSTARDVCLEVNGRDPGRSTMEYLSSRHLRVHKGSWCFGSSRSRGGKIIYLSLVSKSGRESIEVHAETGDASLSQGDVGLLLRKGTYIVRRRPNGEWEISNYTKMCCDSKSEH